MELSYKKALIEYLLSFATEERKSLLLERLRQRTNFMHVVLENIYQSHNASAVLRSCDCFGIQNVHVIESKNPYNINPDVSLGSDKWLNLHKYKGANATLDCLMGLKKKGYRIVSTSLHKKSVSLPEFRPEGPFALVFGTEMTGISKDVEDLTDDFLQIPMYGFTESFNISVSAAICLYDLSNKLRSLKLWEMNEKDKIDNLLKWARTTVKRSEELEKKYTKENLI